jgi:hypothetical protein
MEQVPTPARVTIAPDTEQTDAGVAVKLTVSPEEAVALNVTVVPAGWLESTPKVRVWVPGSSRKLWSIGEAAA